MVRVRVGVRFKGEDWGEDEGESRQTYDSRLGFRVRVRVRVGG
jgi:hypothetical protein